MGPNGNLFKAKLEVPRSGVKRAEQGRASEHIGLGWSDKIKENHKGAYLLDKKRSEIIISD